jgi:reactive intermediate/imine deaminase
VNSVVSSRAPKPLGPYPHARRVGNLLFLSGIGPRHRETEWIPEGIEAQTRACIENVKAILEDAGSSLARVVDVTVFLTNIERDFAAFNRVYGELFGDIRPTRTTVGVVALPVPISIELKVIAEA